MEMLAVFPSKLTVTVVSSFVSAVLSYETSAVISVSEPSAPFAMIKAPFESKLSPSR